MADKKHKALVIVESPAKAKKISGYLGRDYKVLASMGHVRDLPANASEIPEEIKKQKKPWASLGVNTDSDFEPLYVVPKEKKKVVKELKDALKNADELILATDEDREGESIGWHLSELLKPRVPVKRMVFSEITPEAIAEAIANTRKLDENLVEAQETRRVIDRLYGYTLSPLLWKKISRGLSAGRVQSVAVRLLVQRELERLAFRSGTYWDLKADLKTGGDAAFQADLATVSGKRIATGKDFDEATGRLKPDADVLLLGDEQAQSLRARIEGGPWQVTQVEQRPQVRRPYPPFTTSTLQQEANRKLGMSARDTMRTAQRLYEEGVITYMRTDSVHLSNEAINGARRTIRDRYGDDYLSPEVRQYTTKQKNAQEAHEAIRPAGPHMKTADEMGLSGREYQLYALIWKRTVATQMAEARLTFQTVTIASGEAEFRATGRHVDFPGFFRAYVEGVDDPDAALDDQESALPPLSEGARLVCEKLDAISHETKPPARYTEATLVRTLESEGIGRPSTYASIISTIQDRGYVRKSGNQLVPTFTALAVTRLLEDYFPKLVDYGFTAKMEQTLDDIATGEAERLPYLNEFYRGDDGLVDQVKAKEEAIDPRSACTLQLSGLEPAIRVGRYGPYFEMQTNGEKITVSIPDSVAPADISNADAERMMREKAEGPTALGMDPETSEPIFVRNGPFGPYIQRGEMKDDGPKPKRVSIPKNVDPSNVTLDMAQKLLHLPRKLGEHPETHKSVKAGIGRFGPYVVHDGIYKSFNKDGTYLHEGQTCDVLNVDLATALAMLATARRRTPAAPLRELGPHPDDGKPVVIMDGNYGPYVKYGKINATIPKDRTVELVTLEDALGWIAKKAAGKSGRGNRGGATKVTAQAARKTAISEPAESSTAVKKRPKKKVAKKKAATKKSGKKTKKRASKKR